jgi:DNA-binding transcriptional MerR regulator
MNEELLQIIEEMKASGATAAQIDSVIAAYESAPEKKNPNETDGASESEDGSSESKSTDDRNFLEKYVDWWKESWGLDEKPIEERGETRKSLESGMARMVGGLVGIPDKLAKADLAIKMELAKAFGSDEVKQKVQEIQDKINSLPEDKRTSVKLKLQAQTVPAKELFGIDISPINQWFADRADEIKDDQESIDAARKQYETNIINDIGSGKIGQASERIFNGIVESIPMMAATVGTGGTGLAVVGGSVA